MGIQRSSIYEELAFKQFTFWLIKTIQLVRALEGSVGCALSRCKLFKFTARLLFMNPTLLLPNKYKFLSDSVLDF